MSLKPILKQKLWIFLGLISISQALAYADSGTVSNSRYWTQDEEYSETNNPSRKDKRPFFGTQLKEFKMPSWDSFIRQLPSSNLIYWGLSWNSKTPYLQNAHEGFSPASAQKIITATTALRVLGPEFKFSNSFQGQVSADQMNLFLPEFVVSGDPTWALEAYGETLTSRMDNLVSQLVAKGIKRIQGPTKISVIGSKIQTTTRPARWKSSWLNKCYAAIPTPVTLHGNCATFVIVSATKAKWLDGGVNTPLDVSLSLYVPGKTPVVPTVKAILDQSGKVTSYKVRGSLDLAPSEFTVPVHHNEGWLKSIFFSSLKRAGIVYTTVKSKKKGQNAFYADLSSPPLREMIGPFLKESINLVGERLFLEIAEQENAAEDSFPERAQLRTLVPNDELNNAVAVFDGSGLIADNKIPPALMTAYLDAVKFEPYFEDFLNALAVSGVSGTLANRLNSTLVRGKIFAKTGTLNGVSSLAGYYKKSEQDLRPFTIMTQSLLLGAEVKALEDQIVLQFVRDNQ